MSVEVPLPLSKNWALMHVREAEEGRPFHVDESTREGVRVLLHRFSPEVAVALLALRQGILEGSSKLFGRDVYVGAAILLEVSEAAPRRTRWEKIAVQSPKSISPPKKGKMSRPYTGAPMTPK